MARSNLLLTLAVLLLALVTLQAHAQTVMYTMPVEGSEDPNVSSTADSGGLCSLSSIIASQTGGGPRPIGPINCGPGASSARPSGTAGAGAGASSATAAPSSAEITSTASRIPISETRPTGLSVTASSSSAPAPSQTSSAPASGNQNGALGSMPAAAPLLATAAVAVVLGATGLF